MRSGKEDGYGVIYDEEGKPLLVEHEKMITFGKGYNDPGYLQTGGYSGVAKGVTYLTNKRIIFIGTTSWLAALPEHSIDVAHFTYQAAKRSKGISQDKTANYFKYLEVSRDEIKKVKKTFTGEIQVKLEGGYVKFTSSSKDFKKRFFNEFK